MWKCLSCNSLNSDSANFCGCGSPKPIFKPNFCTSENCMYYSTPISDPQREHCPECGKLTTYGKLIDDLC